MKFDTYKFESFEFKKRFARHFRGVLDFGKSLAKLV
jgi:hypothetical protein